MVRDDPAACNSPPVPEGVECDDPPSDALVVFADGDIFNGPVRTGLDHVLVCGSPTFHKPVELSLPVGSDTTNEGDPDTNDGLVRSAAPECANNPNWRTQAKGDRIVAGGTLRIPGVKTDGNFDATLDTAKVDTLPCCTFGPDPVAPGIYYNNDPEGVILNEFTVNTGSITVYAKGDITVRGDITVSGNNPAKGPNIVALISETGNILLDPGNASNSNPACLGIAHSLTLNSVALLTPQGDVFAPGWHIDVCGPADSAPSCASTAPKIIIKGSIAAQRLGLYGQIQPNGTPLSGWCKDFEYPENFWQARPPWWPEFDPKEWRPLR